MSVKKPVRVIVVDDQAIVRSGLGAFIHTYDELQLVGEAQDGEEAIQLCELVRPDVVLMDVKMPKMDGIQATRLIHERWPEIKVLILTSFKEKEVIESAMQAGASGYLLKDATADGLVHAILEVYAGRPMMDPQAALSLEHSEQNAAGREAGRPAMLEQQTVSDELVSAGKIQAGILPGKAPTIRNWDIAATLVPARETSGDFYDFIPLQYGKWGLVIADVTDKGIGAALFMALSSTLIRTYAAQYPTLPALTMSAVNKRILSDTRGNMFVTTFYAVLEPETGRLRYVNAGHNPPYMISAQKGKPVDRLRGTGMALGVEEQATWQQKVVKFAPGDFLLLYTDGITEAQSPSGQFFGEQRVVDIARAQMGSTACEICDALLAEVDRFTDGAPRHDDIALMAVVRQR